MLTEPDTGTRHPGAPAPEAPGPRGPWWQRLGLTGVLGALWATMPAIGGTMLLVYIDSVAGWLTSHGSAGVAVYVGLFILCAGLGLLPTYAQAVLAGWAFGLWTGFAAALTGFTGAALVGYLIARRVAGARVEGLIREDARAKAVRDSLIGQDPLRTLAVVSLLRVPPNSPFALTNLVMAATGVPLRTYLAGTVLGMTPRTFAVVYLGTLAHGTMSAAAAAQSRPAWMLPVGIGMTIVVLVVIGTMARAALRRLTTAPSV